jgi:hypothetical protein
MLCSVLDGGVAERHTRQLYIFKGWVIFERVPCLGPTSSGFNPGHDHEIDSDTPVFLTILRSWMFHARLQGPQLLPLFATTQSEQLHASLRL